MLVLFLLLQADDLDSRLRRRPQVFLDLKEATLAEAFGKLGRAAGFTFQVDPQIAGSRVSFRVDGAPPLSAALELCRAHGGARPVFSTYTTKVLIVPGRPIRPPTDQRGPFFFALGKILASQTHSFDGRAVRKLYLTLWTAWSPEAAPASILAPPLLTLAKDDRGTDLRIQDPSTPRIVHLLGKPILARETTLSLHPAAPDAKRIAVLEGYLEAGFVSATKAVRLDALPGRTAGRELTLLKMARGKRGLTAVFEGPTPKGPFSLADHCLGLAFVDSAGTRYPVRFTTATRGPQLSRFELVCSPIPEQARIVACETQFVTAWATRRIPFRFHDVELP